VLHQTLQWLVAALLGGLVGAAELVSRYRDAPAGTLRSRPAVLYVIINILASLGALALVRTFDWKFSLAQESGPLAVAWSQVLISGAGAMALFRTSLFIVHAGDKDIGIGPSSFLQVFLAAADREVDRARASVRASTVNDVMKDLDFAKALKALPPYCLALMQNLPDDASVLKDKQHFADAREYARSALTGFEAVQSSGRAVQALQLLLEIEEKSKAAAQG
jgi:hypothetical protein